MPRPLPRQMAHGLKLHAGDVSFCPQCLGPLVFESGDLLGLTVRRLVVTHELSAVDAAAFERARERAGEARGSYFRAIANGWKSAARKRGRR